MSYTALIPFVHDKPSAKIEFHNAWGGPARIWDALFNAYVPKKDKYDSWIQNPDDRRLWDLAIRKDLPMFERVVHAFTFDLFYVRKEHFKQFATALRSFVEKYPAEGRVDHLLKWAEWFDNAESDAAGLHGTSVSENPWYRAKHCPHCGQSIDEMESVSLSEGTEVYDWIEQVTL